MSSDRMTSHNFIFHRTHEEEQGIDFSSSFITCLLTINLIKKFDTSCDRKTHLCGRFYQFVADLTRTIYILEEKKLPQIKRSWYGIRNRIYQKQNNILKHPSP